MTEAEIMKEIETLLQIAKFVNSDYVTSPFEAKVLIAIQDLINRKNAKIEELQIKNEHLAGFVDVAYKEIEKNAIIARAEAKAENERLEYTLAGVMHSVDKWLDGDELKQDEVNRAITMREKTLRIVETARAEAIKEFAERVKAEQQYDLCGDDVVDVNDIDKIAKEMGVEL